jgi:PadR family transcriptional regulator PadR
MFILCMSMKKPNKSREPVSLRAAVLQVLVSGEAFGLEISERIEERTNGAISLLQGSLYPTLWDLERDGLVRSRSADPSVKRGGRPRKYYELTADGFRLAEEQRRAILPLFSTEPAAEAVP